MFSYLGRGLLLGMLVCLLVSPGWVSAQDDQVCYVLSRIVRVAPEDEEWVVFEGTDQDFIMTYVNELDGVAASYPGANWEVHVNDGLAYYRQPVTPGNIDLQFTPPPGTWCTGEVKSFVIIGRSTGMPNLQYRYTPRYNYGSWAEVAGGTGTDVFAGETMPVGDFSGEGSLRMLPTTAPEIQMEVLLGSAFGHLLIEYHYVLSDTQSAPGEVSPGEPVSQPAMPPLSVGLIEGVILLVIAWIIWFLFGR